MYCTNCGTKVNRQDNYCPNCGHRIKKDLVLNNRTSEDQVQENQGVFSKIVGFFKIDDPIQDQYPYQYDFTSEDYQGPLDQYDHNYRIDDPSQNPSLLNEDFESNLPGQVDLFSTYDENDSYLDDMTDTLVYKRNQGDESPISEEEYLASYQDLDMPVLDYDLDLEQKNRSSTIFIQTDSTDLVEDYLNYPNQETSSPQEDFVDYQDLEADYTYPLEEDIHTYPEEDLLDLVDLEDQAAYDDYYSNLGYEDQEDFEDQKSKVDIGQGVQDFFEPIGQGLSDLGKKTKDRALDISTSIKAFFAKSKVKTKKIEDRVVQDQEAQMGESFYDKTDHHLEIEDHAYQDSSYADSNDYIDQEAENLDSRPKSTDHEPTDQKSTMEITAGDQEVLDQALEKSQKKTKRYKKIFETLNKNIAPLIRNLLNQGATARIVIFILAFGFCLLSIFTQLRHVGILVTLSLAKFALSYLTLYLATKYAFNSLGIRLSNSLMNFFIILQMLVYHFVDAIYLFVTGRPGLSAEGISHVMTPSFISVFVFIFLGIFLLAANYQKISAKGQSLIFFGWYLVIALSVSLLVFMFEIIILTGLAPAIVYFIQS